MDGIEGERFDDAAITGVSVSGADLLVAYRDWAEKAWTLRFTDVAGYQWFSPEGRALSHVTVGTDDPFLALACAAADEDGTEGFRVYAFVTAWSDEAILKVVAREAAREG